MSIPKPWCSYATILTCGTLDEGYSENTVQLIFSWYYTQSNGDTQNFKQIKVNGNKAVIRYEENEGYTVLVQLGPNGRLTFEGVNFTTEQDMMSAVNTFNIDAIKKMLGEK